MTVNQHYDAGTEEAARKDAEIARLQAEAASYHDAYEMEKTRRAAEVAAKDKLIAELVKAAFIEGWESFQTQCAPMTSVEQEWEQSNAKNVADAALARAKEQQT